MSADGSAVGAADRAVLLAPVARGVNDYRGARIARSLSGSATVKPVHPSGGDVEGGADADDREQHMRQRTGVVVAVVEVPALVVVVGEPPLHTRVEPSTGPVAR